MSDQTINQFESLPATLVPIDPNTGEARKDVVLSDQKWVLDPEGIVEVQPNPKDPNGVLFIPVAPGDANITASATATIV